MRATTITALAVGLAVAFAPRNAGAKEVELEIILDCSGSMTEPMEGRTKFAVAKDTLTALLDGIPDGTRVGLRAYGHRVPTTDREKGCKDTELLVPIGPIQKALMKQKVEGLSCLGFTPIAFSVATAAYDFGHGRDVARTLVVLTDGIETCGGDPVSVCEKLKKAGFELTVHVVGFGIAEKDREALERIAKAGGGNYYSAGGSVELLSGLKAAVKTAIPELAGKERFFMPSPRQARGIEVLEEKGDLLRVAEPDGTIYEVPAYLCFPRRKFDPAALKLGAEVLAVTGLMNHKPHHLEVGVVKETEKGKVHVALPRGILASEPEHLYVVPRLEDGAPVPLEIVKAPETPRDYPASNLLSSHPDDGPACFHLSPPYGVTFKLRDGPKELKRIGVLLGDGAYSHADATTLELYLALKGESGLAWKPIGLCDGLKNRHWLFFKFPAEKAELVHVRIVRLARPEETRTYMARLRFYQDDGPGAVAIGKIDDPKLPVGEAGELEKRAAKVLVEEGEKLREVKVLKRTGDQVIAIGNDGKKVTVPAAKVHEFEPIDVSKLELGDDVLVNEGAMLGGGWNDLFVRATVTEVSKAKIKVQLGSREGWTAPENIFKPPAAPK